MFQEIINHPDVWRYAAMPFISAFVGWITNVVALRMMFYPLNFVGIAPYLGWQGIIPKKARKMATISVELMTTKLIDVGELFGRIEPSAVADLLAPAVSKRAPEIVDGVMSTQLPRVWAVTPTPAQRLVHRRIETLAPDVIMAIWDEFSEDIESVLDLRNMVIDRFVDDPMLLNTVFMRCGADEFKFIERSGIYFGFLFGLVQMVLWIFVQPVWLLPIAGLIVGFATNWLALKMVFEPIEPRKIGRFTVQGLFLKRQAAVADEYASMFAEHILTAPAIIRELLTGHHARTTQSIIRRQVKLAINDALGASRMFAQLSIGPRAYMALQQQASGRILEILPQEAGVLHAYTDQSLGIEAEVAAKMKGLSSAEFEDVLHPIFKEDEWILIAVGAALGLGVGLFQLFVLFG